MSQNRSLRQAWADSSQNLRLLTLLRSGKAPDEMPAAKLPLRSWRLSRLREAVRRPLRCSLGEEGRH